jgi:hypothetical protein
VWQYIDLHGALDGILENTGASGVSDLEKWERVVHDKLNQEHVPMAVRDEVQNSGGSATVSERPNPEGATCNLIEAIVQSMVQEESAGAMVDRAIENAISQINGEISGLSRAGWDQVLAHVETSGSKPNLDLKSRGRIGNSTFYCSPVPLVKWESYETPGSGGGDNGDDGGSGTGFAVVGARRSALVVEGTGSLDRLRQEGGEVQVVAVGDIDLLDDGDDPPIPILRGLSKRRVAPRRRNAEARQSPTARLGADRYGTRGLGADGFTAHGLGAQATYTFEVPSGGVSAISDGRYRIQINQSVPPALQNAISQGGTIPFTVRSYQGGGGNGDNGNGDNGNGNGGDGDNGNGGNGGGNWGGGWGNGSGGTGGNGGGTGGNGQIIAAVSGSTLAIGGASLLGAVLIGALASDEERPRPPPPPRR